MHRIIAFHCPGSGREGGGGRADVPGNNMAALLRWDDFRWRRAGGAEAAKAGPGRRWPYA